MSTWICWTNKSKTLQDIKLNCCAGFEPVVLFTENGRHVLVETKPKKLNGLKSFKKSEPG